MSLSKEFITQIKDRQLNSDREFILDSLRGAIDRLEKAFPRYGSFLMEFIQNADDASSSSLKINLTKNAIIILNDGEVFEEGNVKSICKVGRSSKTPENNIGYLGVGFKSVFLISDCPSIHSGDYRFKFDKHAWDEQSHAPWQIIPLWIDNLSQSFDDSSQFSTIFNIPLKVGIPVDKLRDEVSPEHLNNRILLFLRNIRVIEIVDAPNNLTRKIEKHKISESAEYKTYKILEYENGNLINQDSWVLFGTICDVPDAVRGDYITKDWERDSIEKREVLIALKLNEDNFLVVEKKGTAHIGVFSFLPLKEIPSGLNFLMQADFLTNPGRGELARECAWNNWLAEEIYKLIIHKCIPTLLQNDKWKMNFTEVLYPQQGGHELFEYYIKKPLREYLEMNNVLIAEDGSTAKFNELIAIDDRIRELLSDEDISRLYPNKKVIHNQCKPHEKIRVQHVHSELTDFINHSGELLKHKAEIEDIDWFIKMCLMFIEQYSWSKFREKEIHFNVKYDEFWNRMRDFSAPMILTDTNGLAKINDCFVNTDKLRIPDEIKSQINIVHPKLSKNEVFQQFIKKLNDERHHLAPPTKRVICSLSEDDIKELLRKHETHSLDETKWINLSEAERLLRIKSLKSLWEEKRIEAKDFAYLTFKSSNGEWRPAAELIFLKQYKQEKHDIETLIQKELLDFHFEFISPDFISSALDDDEIRRWRRFLSEMGVDTLLKIEKEGGKLSKIVERISVLTSLQYEKKEGRSPIELGESIKPGYDIESQGRDANRYIEVKGTKELSEEIFLTANELSSLRKHSDSYYVYIVTNALKNPTLHVTLGSKLLDIEDVKIIIPNKRWLTDAKIDEFQP